MKKAVIYNTHGLTLASLAKAKRTYKHVLKSDVKITTIILCMSGLGVNEISKTIGIRPNTAGKYVRAFNTGGLPLLLEYGKSTGKPQLLTKAEREQLCAALLRTPEELDCGKGRGWSTSKLQTYIRMEFGKDMGKAGIYQMLKRMGYIYENDTYVKAEAGNMPKQAAACSKTASDAPQMYL